MSNNTIQAFCGTDKSFTMSITHSDGTAYDLTNCVIKFTVKAERDPDETALIEQEYSDIENPTAGNLSIDISKEELALSPGIYYWEVALVNSLDKLSILGQGIFNVQQKLTDDE